LLFTLIESAAKDYDNTSRGFRFVVFDLFGTVIERANTRDTFYVSKDKARTALNAWLDEFDTLAHYRQAMAEKAQSLANHAQRLLNASNAL
jgi:hypothetical protein